MRAEIIARGQRAIRGGSRPLKLSVRRRYADVPSGRYDDSLVRDRAGRSGSGPVLRSPNNRWRGP